MQVIICDRCGKVYEDGGVKIIIKGESDIRIKQLKKEFDICDDCVKSLIKWTEGEKE